MNKKIATNLAKTIYNRKILQKDNFLREYFENVLYTYGIFIEIRKMFH